MSKSSVQQLREQIEQECQALQNMLRFSAGASHQAIYTRYKNLEQCHAQLKPLVGEQQAVTIIVDTYNRWVK
jgi:hypothetical protein